MRHVFKSVIDWRHVLVVFVLLSAIAFPSQAEAVTIGQRYAGGVVFYVDGSGQHGLVAATRDLPGQYEWQQAKEACERFVHNGYSDWYLPSKWELNELHQHKNSVGGFVGNSSHWSSSEFNTYSAWVQDFHIAWQADVSKDNNLSVRAVRAF